MFRTKLSFGDAIAAVAVLLVAVLLLWHPWQRSNDGETLVIVTPDATMEYSLSENRTIEIESRGVHLCIEIADGKASVSKSDCPDGVCVGSASISKTGETIICAPAGVSLVVKGGEGDVDFVAG